MTKCPFCGSKNTARIMYGMPAFTDEFQKLLDSGKIYIGGCCIDSVPDGNGNRIIIDTKYYCNECEKEFGTPPYLVAKDWKSCKAYADIVTGVHFTRYDELAHYPGIDIEFKRNDAGALVIVHQNRSLLPMEDRQISGEEWQVIVKRLYSGMHLHEWKENYKPRDIVLDGERWSLEITLTGQRRQTYKGENAYPPYWRELVRLMGKYLKG